MPRGLRVDQVYTTVMDLMYTYANPKNWDRDTAIEEKVWERTVGARDLTIATKQARRDKI